MDVPMLTDQERRIVLLGLHLLQNSGHDFDAPVNPGPSGFGPHLGITRQRLNDTIAIFENGPVSWGTDLWMAYCATMEVQLWNKGWYYKPRKRSFSPENEKAVDKLHGKTLYLRGSRFKPTMDLLGEDGLTEIQAIEQQLLIAA